MYRANKTGLALKEKKSIYDIVLMIWIPWWKEKTNHIMLQMHTHTHGCTHTHTHTQMCLWTKNGMHRDLYASFYNICFRPNGDKYKHTNTNRNCANWYLTHLCIQAGTHRGLFKDIHSVVFNHTCLCTDIFMWMYA